jgi:hypothetical protein
MRVLNEVRRNALVVGTAWGNLIMRVAPHTRWYRSVGVTYASLVAERPPTRRRFCAEARRDRFGALPWQ